jgi:hypothetical protein
LTVAETCKVVLVSAEGGLHSSENNGYEKRSLNVAPDTMGITVNRAMMPREESHLLDFVRTELMIDSGPDNLCK